MARAFDSMLQRLTEIAIVLLTVAMAGAVLLGVFFRYVVGDALSWSEEAARYAMVWLSWVGGGLALRRGGHIAVDFLLDALPAGLRRIVVAAVHLIVIGFLVLLLVTSLDLTSRVGFQSTIALGVSMQVPYASMPVGAALMLYHALVLLVAGRSGPALRASAS